MEAAGASAICTGGRQDVAPCGADVENDETLYGQKHPVKDYFLICHSVYQLKSGRQPLLPTFHLHERLGEIRVDH